MLCTYNCYNIVTYMLEQCCNRYRAVIGEIHHSEGDIFRQLCLTCDSQTVTYPLYKWYIMRHY